MGKETQNNETFVDTDDVFANLANDIRNLSLGFENCPKYTFWKMNSKNISAKLSVFNFGISESCENNKILRNCVFKRIELFEISKQILD